MRDYQPDDLIDTNELAKLLGVSPKTVRNRIAERSILMPLNIAGRMCWRYSTVMKWLDAVEFLQSRGLILPQVGKDAGEVEDD